MGITTYELIGEIVCVLNERGMFEADLPEQNPINMDLIQTLQDLDIDVEVEIRSTANEIKTHLVAFKNNTLVAPAKSDW